MKIQKEYLLFLSLLFSVASLAEPELKFNSNGKFKILQLTDLHFGEDAKDDYLNIEIMTNLINWEKPDIVAVTGDIISGYMWDGESTGWYENNYKNFTKAFYNTNTRWATTLGNHDSEGDLTREEINLIDRTYDLSLTKPSAEGVSHAFNYFLPVYDSAGSEEHMRLWFLDSGDYDCMGVEGYDCVLPDQIEWIREEAKKVPADHKSKGKGFLFMHIPIPEYMNMYNYNEWYGHQGESVCCSSLNTGLFAAIREQNICEWVSVGHDHNNDYYGEYHGVVLGFGRKTGYGQYGPEGILRGGRVFEITEDPHSIETWVRLGDGQIHRETETTTRGESEFIDKCCKALNSPNPFARDDLFLRSSKYIKLREAEAEHLQQY